MTRPRLLDLFCGGGGASVGYHRAGFDVVGVDLRPMPRYPFEFHQADAMTYPLDGFDVIHASPPCQAYTQMSAKWRGKGGKADSHPDLLAPTRSLLRASGLPYVIENVQGAKNHMEVSLVLHGGMFGLGVHRPRLFESNLVLLGNRAKACREPIGVYGHTPDGRELWTRKRNNGNMKGKKSIIRCARTLEEAQQAMGIDWMTWDEIRESIPPAYTEFIGAQLISQLSERAS